MAKPRKPTVKQQQFASKLLVPGMSQAEAYAQTYGTTNRQYAIERASRLVAKPHMQAHIKEIIHEAHPALGQTCASTLANLIEDPDTPANTKLKAIDLIAKYLGWNAPSRSEHLHAKIDVSKYKLPGSE